MKVITTLATIVRVVHMHMYELKALSKKDASAAKNPSSYFYMTFFYEKKTEIKHRRHRETEWEKIVFKMKISFMLAIAVF